VHALETDLLSTGRNIDRRAEQDNKLNLTQLDDRSSIADMGKNDTRSKIISIGTDLIASHGFSATGIDMVLKVAGVPKGSFYHYFRSKEDFGLAVIDRFAARYDERLASFLRNESQPPLARIRDYLLANLERVERNNCSKGCLVGNLGQELSDRNERFRQRLEEVFQSWQDQLAECFREAQMGGELSSDLDAAIIAEFMLSGMEGAILRAKVMKSPQPLRDFINILFARVLKQP
jgi:TetR/AcrR family transcriptional repressor of nem operon